MSLQRKYKLSNPKRWLRTGRSLLSLLCAFNPSPRQPYRLVTPISSMHRKAKFKTGLAITLATRRHNIADWCLFRYTFSRFAFYLFSHFPFLIKEKTTVYYFCATLYRHIYIHLQLTSVFWLFDNIVTYFLFLLHNRFQFVQQRRWYNNLREKCAGFINCSVLFSFQRCLHD